MLSEEILWQSSAKVQCQLFGSPIVEGRSSIPGHGTKMPQAMKYGPPKKKNAK